MQIYEPVGGILTQTTMGTKPLLATVNNTVMSVEAERAKEKPGTLHWGPRDLLNQACENVKPMSGN